MAEGKKIIVELSKIGVNVLDLVREGEGWRVRCSYAVSDAANTVRRSGTLEFVTGGKQTLDDLYAAAVLMI